MSTMQSVGKYQLMRELGKGATGKVYLAEDPFNKSTVAIKVAFPEEWRHTEDAAGSKITNGTAAAPQVSVNQKGIRRRSLTVRRLSMPCCVKLVISRPKSGFGGMSVIGNSFPVFWSTATLKLPSNAKVPPPPPEF